MISLINESNARFTLGRLVITRRAHELIPHNAINRHIAGEWGDLDAEDQAENEASLNPDNPGRLLSSYASIFGDRFYIITEADRSSTPLTKCFQQEGPHDLPRKKTRRA